MRKSIHNHVFKACFQVMFVAGCFMALSASVHAGKPLPCDAVGNGCGNSFLSSAISIPYCCDDYACKPFPRCECPSANGCCDNYCPKTFPCVKAACRSVDGRCYDQKPCPRPTGIDLRWLKCVSLKRCFELNPCD